MVGNEARAQYTTTVNAARGVLGLRALPPGHDPLLAEEGAGVLDTAGLPPLVVNALRDALVEVRALLASGVVPSSAGVWGGEMERARVGVANAMYSPYFERDQGEPTEVGVRRLDEAVATLAAVALVTPAVLAALRERHAFVRAVNHANGLITFGEGQERPPYDYAAQGRPQAGE